jgi:hypothetical protein
MSGFKLPFVNSNQKFNISLDGKSLSVTCVWNQEIPAWVISIQDANTGDDIITGVSLVTGVNLFEQFYYTGVTGFLIVYTNGNPTEIPTFESLGNESNVYYLTELAR